MVTINNGESGGSVRAKLNGNFPKPPLIAAIGSSTIARGESNGAGGTVRTWAGIGNAMNIMAQGRAYMPQSYNRAVSGVGTVEMSTTQLAEVLALSPRPKACLFIGGSNDATAGTAWATTSANIEAVVDALIDAGITPILGTPQPTIGQSVAIQLRLARLADFVRGLVQRKQGCILVDPIREFMDPTLTTYEALAPYMENLSPAIHLNHWGTQIYAQAIVNALADAGWPKTNVSVVSNGDLYDATENAGGNLIANGLLTGTGGSITGTGGLTGTAPTGWIINTGVGGTNIAARDTDGTGCKVTLGGSASGGAPSSMVLYRDLTAPELANIASGDTISLTVDVSSAVATNILAIQADMRFTISGVTYDDFDGGSAGNSGPLEAFDGALRTVPRLMTAAPTAGRVRLLIYPGAAGAWSGEITFKSARVSKV